MVEERIPAGQSPTLYVHRSDDETFYVLDGTVTFEVGGERFTATDGSTVFAPHGIPHSYLIEEETRWLVFVRKPGLERPWASVGSPAESLTIFRVPDGSEGDERMNRVAEQVDRYGIEIVGDPLTADRTR